MAKKKSNFGGQATVFLVVLTLKWNPQNTQRVKRLTYDPKRFAVEQRIWNSTLTSTNENFCLVSSLGGNFPPNPHFLTEKTGRFWSKFFNQSDSTFLSAIIPHQMRPSDPKSEKLFGTPPSSVPPLTLEGVCRTCCGVVYQALYRRAPWTGPCRPICSKGREKGL